MRCFRAIHVKRHRVLRCFHKTCSDTLERFTTQKSHYRPSLKYLLIANEAMLTSWSLRARNQGQPYIVRTERWKTSHYPHSCVFRYYRLFQITGMTQVDAGDLHWYSRKTRNESHRREPRERPFGYRRCVTHPWVW